MFKKENLPPSKQGVFYQLNLNKNNGPYLSKDIMFNNPKSNHLLTNPTILNQHKRMVDTLTLLQKTSKMQTSKEEKTQNFNTIVKFCEQQLSNCQEVSEALKLQQYNFKKETESLYDKISSMNNQLLESSMPVLKNLMKKVKETNQCDKAEYYKIQKQLQNLEMEKRALEHVILSCRLKIQNMEKSFGVKPINSTNSFITSDTHI